MEEKLIALSRYNDKILSLWRRGILHYCPYCGTETDSCGGRERQIVYACECCNKKFVVTPNKKKGTERIKIEF